MDTYETNRMNMIRTTRDYCVDHAAATAAITQYAIVVTSVSNKITLIDALNIIATGTTAGVTLDTNLLRKTMSDIAFKCGSATSAYASSVSNNTLKAIVAITRPAYDKFRKDEVDDKCQAVHDAANTNIVAVTPFGISAADVTDLQTAINLYVAAMQGPRQARISISSALEQIKFNISDTIQNLLKNQLDKMTDTIKLSNSVYFSEYHLAREIIDLGVTHAKLRGTIKDNSDNPISGASIQLSRTSDGVVVYTETSGVDGKYSISPITADDYDITVTATGFQVQQESNVHFAAGKEVKRSFALIPV